MILTKKRITKALIRLRGCPGWSAPVLFANPRRQVFSRRGPNGNSNKQRLNNKRINILERTIAKTTGAEGCRLQCSLLAKSSPWPRNVTLVHCRPTKCTARTRHRTLTATRHLDDKFKYSKTCVKTASLKKTENWFSRPIIA